MYKEINHGRRRFLRSTAMSIAAAQLGMMRAAHAQSNETRAAAPPLVQQGTNSTFGALKQIDAGVLNVGYAEAGPANGPAVILLHGWPYDIHSYSDITALLASKSGFASKVVDSASPPDVRRGLPRRTPLTNGGASPLVRALPHGRAEGHTRGLAQVVTFTRRRGIAFAAHPAAEP